jgi:hypothetical protein
MRYVRFRHRRRHFTSLAQINRRPHSRFGVSRRERFESVEKAALKPPPATPFDVGEWKKVKLHPDCYVQLESAYYSAPHIHRGKLLRVKLTEHHVEIFLELERLAVHPRCRHRAGRSMRTSRRPHRRITRPHRRSRSRSRVSSIRNRIASSSTCSTPRSTATSGACRD